LRSWTITSNFSEEYSGTVFSFRRAFTSIVPTIWTFSHRCYDELAMEKFATFPNPRFISQT
jgi:hypothetical protein